MSIKFKIEKKLTGKLGRAGVLETPHGIIKTPSFVTVGTKATVKALAPEQVKNLGAQVVLANTYHLYLQPGSDIIEQAGGLNKFMNWPGPTMTDSGGFQVFSLGVAYGKEGLSKFISTDIVPTPEQLAQGYDESRPKLAKIDADGVTFKSSLDGSSHRLNPEISINIQHQLGADMIFAFDECTSPHADYEYLKEANDRTNEWVRRSLAEHQRLKKERQGSEKLSLFGIVQGGRFKDLRQESARVISTLDFDGFGIGGSFVKKDLEEAVTWVNEILPEAKPRHLLGVGEPLDLFLGVESGVDLFDCVAPTRIARNGTLYTKQGKINIENAKYVRDFAPIEADCGCYTCLHYTAAYLSHLFRAKEMLASTLASIHNLYFSNKLVADIRQSILDDRFDEFREEFFGKYKI